MRLSKHIAEWLTFWVFWVGAGEQNHSNLLINGGATALLLLACAAAVYVNRLVLVPAF